MPSSSPLPQTREDVAIHAFKGGFTQHVPMIVGPTANLRVELIDQIGGRHAPCVLDDSSDAIQEGSNILLGRLDGQFPVRVAAQRSPEKSTDCTTVGVCAKGIKKELNTLDEADFVRDVDKSSSHQLSRNEIANDNPCSRHLYLVSGQIFTRLTSSDS
jgi:hypothetical protein